MERREQIMHWIKEILDKNLSDVSYRAFVFGSQANKAVLKKADIDVGIIADDMITSLQLSNIHAEIEKLPMLYKIDLVNFKDTDANFRTIAMQNIESL